MKGKRDVKERVRAQYTGAASSDDAPPSTHARRLESMEYAKSIGYSEQELGSVPDGATVTHGCGNPVALADLKAGEAVLDLGCGGGLDVFLAAQRVGVTGRAIGVDMTPAMIEKARANARAGNYANVELRVAEMERLPIADGAVDVVISNCVINHSPDKLAVFREAHRVLKAGGRAFVSDLVTAGRLPEDVLRNAGKLWTEWLRVASAREEYLAAFDAAGFRTVRVLAEGPFPMAESDDILRGRIISIQLKGIK